MSFLWEMELEVYHCLGDVNPEFAFFEFESEGPKGKIRKVVYYQIVEPKYHEKPSFNLFFGDWDDIIRRPDDKRVTNNGDAIKVLATVAHTIITATNVWGGCTIYVRGSTVSRTRLYQIKIKAHWTAINKLFFIQGSINGRWEEFRKDKSYEAFSVTRR